jgi:hypothetical protein
VRSDVPAIRRKASGVVKAVIIGAVVVFLVFYVMTSPTQAATIVHASWRLAVHLAHGAGDFVNKLA